MVHCNLIAHDGLMLHGCLSFKYAPPSLPFFLIIMYSNLQVALRQTSVLSTKSSQISSWYKKLKVLLGGEFSGAKYCLENGSRIDP